MRTTAALFMALMAAAALGAEVYTWRDADGKVHYSDTPPAGADVKKLRGGVQVNTAPPAQAAPRRGLADQEMEFRKRKTDTEAAQAKAEKEKTEVEEGRRNCEQARAQLQSLETGRRISRLNAQGETVVLDDDMRTQETERTKKAVQTWCK